MRQMVLYSGGPDSLMTLHKVRLLCKGNEVIPIYFDLGHRYSTFEEDVVRDTVNGVLISRMFSMGDWEQASAHIPNRNAFLILGASMFMQGEKGSIWISLQKDEMSIEDRSPVFLAAMEETLRSLGYQVRIRTPWEDMDKTDMVGWYLGNGGSVQQLKMTRSCYDGEDSIQCGKCSACIRRYIAFSFYGIDERYREFPPDSDLAKEYVRRANARVYSIDRCKRILEALR